jgi:hypothetical protein
MGISKVAFSLAKTIDKNKVLQNEVKSVTTNVVKVAENKVMFVLDKGISDFGEILPQNSSYHKYSKETKDLINKIRENIFAEAKINNKEKFFTDRELSLKYLTLCDNEKMVSRLLKTPSDFLNYYKRFVKIYNLTPKIQALSVADKKNFVTNMTLMSLFNEKNFAKLWKSKGIDEIFAGNLSASYLNNFNIMGKYDENFFYKMFENLEKTSNERIAKSGFNSEIINKYFKLQDNEICLNPNFCNEFLTKLENVKNPESVNKILSKFKECNSSDIQYNIDILNKILDEAKENPQNLEKVLKIKNSNMFSILNNLHIFGDKENLKITDEIYNYYLKLEKTNPEFCKPYTLREINDFLKRNDCDENLLKDIVSVLCKNNNGKNMSDVLYKIDKSNFEYLKECVKKGEITEKDIFKISQIKDFNNLAEVDFANIDKLYNETYLPIKNILDKKLDKDLSSHITENLVTIKKVSPEKFKEIQELNIVELIGQGKISPRILKFYNKDFEILPEIKSDIKKLLNGEKLVKKFYTTKNVLNKTKSGDVVSIKGKMYVNNNGHLEPWKMSEEKFNELFPLVDRFSTVQGNGDCYFISALNSLYKNPKTRGLYYKMFKQEGKDILVTIPAYKDFKGTVRFPNAEIKTMNNSSDAAKNVQMLEQAYARVSLRNSYDLQKSVSNNENPLVTDNLDFLYSRIYSGHSDNVYNEFLSGLKKSKNFEIVTLQDKDKISECITKNLNNPNYIITDQFIVHNNTGHVISLDKINASTSDVSIIDPSIPAVSTNYALSDILKKIYNLVVVRLA